MTGSLSSAGAGPAQSPVDREKSGVLSVPARRSTSFFLGAGVVISREGVARTLDFLWMPCLFATLPLLVRGSKERSSPESPSSLSLVERHIPSRGETLVLVSFFLFHLVNAPLLPLLRTLHENPHDAIAWIPWIAEIFMVLSALLLRRICRSFPKAFLVLAMRMALYGEAPSAQEMLGVACLDGISSGHFKMAALTWVDRRAARRRTSNQIAGYVDIAVLSRRAVSLWGIAGAVSASLWLASLPMLFLLQAGRGARGDHSKSPI